jgi:hypothetical protein
VEMGTSKILYYRIILSMTRRCAELNQAMMLQKK